MSTAKPNDIHFRAARGALGWSQQETAAKSGLSKNTVQAAERRGSRPHGGTVFALRHTYESAGIEFLFDPPGIRLRADEG